jgi:hypothetical protein
VCLLSDILSCIQTLELADDGATDLHVNQWTVTEDGRQDLDQGCLVWHPAGSSDINDEFYLCQMCDGVFHLWTDVLMHVDDYGDDADDGQPEAPRWLTGWRPHFAG